jgi:hypothetical protein
MSGTVTRDIIRREEKPRRTISFGRFQLSTIVNKALEMVNKHHGDACWRQEG